MRSRALFSLPVTGFWVTSRGSNTFPRAGRPDRGLELHAQAKPVRGCVVRRFKHVADGLPVQIELRAVGLSDVPVGEKGFDPQSKAVFHPRADPDRAAHTVAASSLQIYFGIVEARVHIAQVTLNRSPQEQVILGGNTPFPVVGQWTCRLDTERTVPVRGFSLVASRSLDIIVPVPVAETRKWGDDEFLRDPPVVSGQAPELDARVFGVGMCRRSVSGKSVILEIAI